MKRRGHYDAEMQKFERSLLLSALGAHRWNRVDTAKFLGISYRSLLYRMKDHGLGPNQREHAS